MKKRTIKDLFNIPNCLCYFRIILIPIFLHRYFLASCKEDYYLCAFILILSGISDFLDGYIARHYHMVTDFGKVIDPIADKLTQFTVAVVLIYTYSWMWFLLGIIVIKDGMLALGGLYLYEKGAQVKGASWWGKISTAIFDIVAIILVGIHIPDSPISTIMIIVCIILMGLSLVLYAKQLLQMYWECKNEQKTNQINIEIIEVEMVLNQLNRLKNQMNISNRIVERDLLKTKCQLELSLAALCILLRKMCENQFIILNQERRKDINSIIHSNRFDFFEDDKVYVYSQKGQEEVNINQLLDYAKRIFKEIV